MVRFDPARQRAGGSPKGSAAARELLLGQLAAIQRGDTLPRPQTPQATAPALLPDSAGLPRMLHLALGLLLAAAAVAFSGGSVGFGGGEPVRLNVLSLARAADGGLEVMAQQAAPASGTPLIAGEAQVRRPGTPTWIALPELGIDARVQEAGLVLRRGVPTWEIVADAVAHYDGSAVPGEPGNVVMAGHLNTPLSRQGAVFRALPQARVGQLIHVWSGETRYTYTVDSVRIVAPADTSAMAPTEEATLTLITCYPDYDFSERLVVTAKFTPGA